MAYQMAVRGLERIQKQYLFKKNKKRKRKKFIMGQGSGYTGSTSRQSAEAGSWRFQPWKQIEKHGSFLTSIFLATKIIRIFIVTNSNINVFIIQRHFVGLGVCVGGDVCFVSVVISRNLYRAGSRNYSQQIFLSASLFDRSQDELSSSCLRSLLRNALNSFTVSLRDISTL